MSRTTYIVGDMADLYDVEIEPEVRAWLESLPARHYRKAERMVMLLADDPTTRRTWESHTPAISVTVCAN